MYFCYLVKAQAKILNVIILPNKACFHNLQLQLSCSDTMFKYTHHISDGLLPLYCHFKYITLLTILFSKLYVNVIFLSCLNLFRMFYVTVHQHRWHQCLIIKPEKLTCGQKQSTASRMLKLTVMLVLACCCKKVKTRHSHKCHTDLPC